MTQQDQILKLMNLFIGNARWIGQMSSELLPEADDPTKINHPRRGFANGPVTTEHWKAHLEGTEGLGIVPITDYQESKFMAIDLDVSMMENLKVTLTGVQEKINHFQLPMVLCRSKSGGCHLYVFFKEMVPTK